jgi:hypothetical protein
MADDFAPAVIAFRSYHMDRALETVKDMRFVFEPDFERLVVVVSAMFALGHKFLLLSYIRFLLRFVFAQNAIII